jgi:uncharacterized protein (TIGR03437 family)
LSGRWKRAGAAILICAATAIPSRAQSLTTLVTFNGTNGAVAESLVLGTDGNFYGTTSQGGGVSCPLSVGCGTVFKMTPGGTLTTLYSFDGTDGQSPLGLIQATDGNFYGPTGGGASGKGTVFKMTPGGTLTTLCSFGPGANLIQATDGNFYGTAGGGDYGSGTIFKMTLGCALTTLYSFEGGADPFAPLVQATDGNFYGTTPQGPPTGLPVISSGPGSVFKITPEGTFTTLYSFCSQGNEANCAEGANSEAALIQATDGNFYGTTALGGSDGWGTIFKITPGGMLTTLYSFTFGADGAEPIAPLIQATDGNFYGTTRYGGAAFVYGTASGGTIFKITPAGTLTTVYGFTGGPDGGIPVTGLVQGTNGSLYGTTSAGGNSNYGTIFSLSLPAATLPAIGSVANAASFQAGIVPNSWITIFGTNLSSITDNWANAIINGNLPTSLDGVKVSVGEEPTYISYISPTQINALAPNVGPGVASVTVTNSSGASSPVTAIAQIAQPAFFQWGNYAVATHQDYSLAAKNGTIPGVTTVPAAPGEVIILWGTGFGPTTPSAPVGVEVPFGTTYYTANTVTVTVGSTPATVYATALSPGFAGLYQVAIQIPTSLASGDYPVIATVSDESSPSTTLITVQE